MRHPTFTALMAATALCLSFASPAAAEGKADRARAAIAEAQTKIDTAEALGTSTAQPGQTAEANAALASAKENLAAGHKPEAIADAIRASALAETALGLMQKHAQQHTEAVQAQAAANGAQAQASVEAAHQQTDMANDRAARAEVSAAASASDAAVARNAAMTVQAAQPTQVQTTVTTEQAAPAPAPATVRRVVVTHAKRSHRRVVHHRHVARHMTPGKVTTTTTVTHTGM